MTISEALAYRYGINRNIDLAKSIEYFKQLAKQGCAQAHFELSRLYAHHFCISALPHNILKRDEHLFAAAKQGHMDAIVELLVLLRREMSTYDFLYYPNKNQREYVINEIVKVVRYEIDQGNTMALIIQGAFLEDCTVEGVHYLFQAWEKGEKYLASLYLSIASDEHLKQLSLPNRKTWKKNNQKLRSTYFKKLVQELKEGNVQSIHKFIYGQHATWIDWGNLEKLRQKLINFYQQQIEQGSEDALLQKIILLDDELGIEPLKLLAEKGNSIAAYKYANHLDGLVDQDHFDEIQYYFRIAAEASHPCALYEYGRYYIDDNLELALKYFKNAGSLDCPPAYLILADLTKGEEQVRWAELALKHDERNDFTLSLLKESYAKGYGVSQDFERSQYLQFVVDANLYWSNVLEQPLSHAVDIVQTNTEPLLANLLESKDGNVQ